LERNILSQQPVQKIGVSPASLILSVLSLALLAVVLHTSMHSQSMLVKEFSPSYIIVADGSQFAPGDQVQLFFANEQQFIQINDTTPNPIMKTENGPLPDFHVLTHIRGDTLFWESLNQTRLAVPALVK
jgi:hypothetical protein